MVKIVSVIPAKHGLTGASLALVHLLLGVVRRARGVVRVTVITSAAALRYPAFKRLRQAGAVCHVMNIDGYPSPLYWLFLALRLAVSGRHDIAHFSTPKTFLLMYPSALLAARRRILTLEGYPPYELKEAGFRERVLGVISWILGLKLADSVTTCSRWLQKIVERTHGYAGKLTAVHNPIDLERFSGPPERAAEGPLVLVARLHRVKGVDVALRALAHLKEKTGRAPRLLIIGEGEEGENLRRMMDDLDIAGKVDFLGHRYDVEAFIREAGIVLVPSRYEPFGMTAAEAGAAGKPVIASSTGGLKEIVEDGVTGYLFEPDDYRGLAEKIEKLVSDAGLRERMGAAAAKRVAGMFAPEVVAAELLRVYLSVLREPARRPEPIART
ncbi:MAG: glycosyltransferase family 4 protein [Nitrososphaerota archaeon]